MTLDIEQIDLSCSGCGEYAGTHISDIIGELETKIADQAAEIERLRGYMTRVAETSEYYGKDDTYCSAQTLAIAHHSTCRLAHAALNEKQET